MFLEIVNLVCVRPDEHLVAYGAFLRLERCYHKTDHGIVVTVFEYLGVVFIKEYVGVERGNDFCVDLRTDGLLAELDLFVPQFGECLALDGDAR